MNGLTKKIYSILYNIEHIS